MVENLTKKILVIKEQILLFRQGANIVDVGGRIYTSRDQKQLKLKLNGIE